MSVEIKEFRPFQKNSLQGFITILLSGNGLEIRDCSLHEKNGRRWINLPAKPFKKSDNTTGWINIVSFPDKDIYYRFQQEALSALDSYLEINQDIQGKFDDDRDLPF